MNILKDRLNKIDQNIQAKPFKHIINRIIRNGSGKFKVTHYNFDEFVFNGNWHSEKIGDEKFTNYIKSYENKYYIVLDKIFEKLYNDNYNFLDEFELDEYEASEFTSQSKRLKRIIKKANNIKEEVELPAIHKFKPTRKQRKIDKIYDGIRLFVSEDDEQGIIELYLVDLYHLAIDSENYSIGMHDLNKLYKSKEDFSKCISKTSDKYI